MTSKLSSSVYRYFVDDNSPSSIARRLRARRFEHFLSLLPDKPLSILDVGGTVDFWKAREVSQRNFRISVLNLTPTRFLGEIRCIQGDARDMSCFQNDEFDVVFSNSVIEHVGDFSDQKKMADEIQRVGRAYYVQTPNYYFPIEPHFLFPGFQFLPKTLQKRLVKNFSLGCSERAQTDEEAELLVNSVRLMTLDDLCQLFPQASTWKERIFGLDKSIVVYDGFERL